MLHPYSVTIPFRRQRLFDHAVAPPQKYCNGSYDLCGLQWCRNMKPFFCVVLTGRLEHAERIDLER
jgi:hypothetical protein